MIRRLIPTFLAASLLLCLGLTPVHAQTKPTSDRPVHGLGSVHMDISCSPGVSADFDRALALLHNFWYARALEAFTEVAQRGRDSGQSSSRRSTRRIPSTRASSTT